MYFLITCCFSHLPRPNQIDAALSLEIAPASNSTRNRILRGVVIQPQFPPKRRSSSYIEHSYRRIITVTIEEPESSLPFSQRGHSLFNSDLQSHFLVLFIADSNSLPSRIMATAVSSLNEDFKEADAKMQEIALATAMMREED